MENKKTLLLRIKTGLKLDLNAFVLADKVLNIHNPNLLVYYNYKRFVYSSCFIL